MLTGLLTGAYNFGSEWLIRFVVSFSLGAHVYLSLFAGIRRRQAYGARIGFLWLAYQFLDWAAPYVLSNLSLGSTSRELHLITLWLPCMVAYRAGPDNLTAYSFEDAEISMRQYVNASLQVVTSTIVYVLAKQIVTVASKGALFWASVVMVVVGVFKYGERVCALREGNFGYMRSSGKKKQEKLRIQPCCHTKLLGNEPALLLAHHLLGITKRAFADYSVKDAERELNNDSNLKYIFYVQSDKNKIGWDNMCKVVEMELSLMYDIIYTKAAVIHNWFGYFIRVLSPMVTATVSLLFLLYSKDGQRTADVIITYIMLAVTLLLDVRWLLGAAVSTWTYVFFNASSERWLRHEVCLDREVCRIVWWHRLRRFVVFLDPWPLPLRDHYGGYRLWSATIGQYNIFDEATDNTIIFSWLLKKLSLEETWMAYKYSRRCFDLNNSKFAKGKLFTQIKKMLNMVPRKEVKYEEPTPPDDTRTHQRRRELDEKLDFLPEFQELILIWHVATDVFLFCSYRQGTGNHKEMKYVKAIGAVSNYMAFLAAIRPDMLPGLKLRSLYQATRQALDELWKSSGTAGDRKEKLIEILKRKEKEDGEVAWRGKRRSRLYDFSIVLSDAIKFAELLPKVLNNSQKWYDTLNKDLQEGSNSWKRFLFLIPDLDKPSPKLDMLSLLKLMLKSWVRMLIYVSIRCGRDSHVKQLGRGCELTTFVWILSEHAGIFSPVRPQADR